MPFAPSTRPRATNGAALNKLKAAVALAVDCMNSRRLIAVVGLLLVFILRPACPRRLCLRQPKIGFTASVPNLSRRRIPGPWSILNHTSPRLLPHYHPHTPVAGRADAPAASALDQKIPNTTPTPHPNRHPTDTSSARAVQQLQACWKPPLSFSRPHPQGEPTRHPAREPPAPVPPISSIHLRQRKRSPTLGS